MTLWTEPLPSPDSVSSEFKTVLAAIRLVAFDFDGVFTDNLVYVFEDGREAVRCTRADGIGLRELERVAITPVILSSETNTVVAARARKLRVRCIHGVENKLEALTGLARELKLAFDQIAFVGNDANDAECLRAVALPIVVHDAHPSVLPLARYRTTARGGYGAVREVGDLFAGVLARNGDK
jgi:YrbI family 3-deoxy-D-manno-octulosonate 8-phosphate phosphatase